MPEKVNMTRELECSKIETEKAIFVFPLSTQKVLPFFEILYYTEYLWNYKIIRNNERDVIIHVLEACHNMNTVLTWPSYSNKFKVSEDVFTLFSTVARDL